METKARYVLVGLFTLVITGAAFGFIYWLHSTGGLRERTVFRVRFENTVSGLLTGAAVAFAIKVALPTLHPVLTAVCVLGPYGLVFLGAMLAFRMPEASAVFRNRAARFR